MKIKESQLRTAIRDAICERLTSRIFSPAARGSERYHGGRSRRRDARDGETIASGDFIAEIPPGTSTAFPVGRLPGEGAPRLSSGAGGRRRPNKDASSLHKGRDYAVKSGTPVVAYADGTISRAGGGGNAGNIITVTHPFTWSDGSHSGTVQTQYMHLDKFIKTNGPVKAGEIIALSGNTGNSTGPHLHFTFKIGGKQSYNDSLYSDRLDAATVIAVNDKPIGFGEEEEIAIAEGSMRVTFKQLQQIIKEEVNKFL